MKKTIILLLLAILCLSSFVGCQEQVDKKAIKAQNLADEALVTYHLPKEGSTKARTMPDNTIIEVTVEDQVYYFMCIDDKIVGSDEEYKTLIETEDYILTDEAAFSHSVKLYIRKDSVSPDELDNLQSAPTEKQIEEARIAAESVKATYEMPSVEREGFVLPDESVIVIWLEGRTFYFLYKDGCIGNYSDEYKALITSEDYEKDNSFDYGDGITLYLKKTK